MKVTTRMNFCRKSIRSVVSTGKGSNKIARSVMMLIGAEARYSATMSMHVPSMSVNAAEMGLHWKMLRKVRMMPARLTTIIVISEA
jgi:hypothetical protein